MYTPAPQVLQAQLSDSGESITVAFDSPTNEPGTTLTFIHGVFQFLKNTLTTTGVFDNIYVNVCVCGCRFRLLRFNA